MTLSEQIKDLKKRVLNSVNLFSTGHAVLIGDDGKRENEVDLVFHASFATTEIVNLSITHAKGLLCVALDHELADKLGFYTAPRFPGGISHTNFTLSVDAKNGISSGISARDRAHTIKLMADEKSNANDFITPGHIFPLRAMNGGLHARAGHTEALYELCKLSHLPSAGAMCEILDVNGEPISPDNIKNNEVFSKFSFISTVDLLWHKILYLKNENCFQKEDQNNHYSFMNPEEESITLPCAVQFHSSKIKPDTIRIVLNNGFESLDNGVSRENCCAEIILLSLNNLTENLPDELSDFCSIINFPLYFSIFPTIGGFIYYL